MCIRLRQTSQDQDPWHMTMSSPRTPSREPLIPDYASPSTKVPRPRTHRALAALGASLLAAPPLVHLLWEPFLLSFPWGRHHGLRACGLVAFVSFGFSLSTYARLGQSRFKSERIISVSALVVSFLSIGFYVLLFFALFRSRTS
jgi:hypothetical protein